MKTKNIKKALTSMVVAGMVLSNSVVAMAATKQVDGGNWGYGTNLTKCYSNYYHGSKSHNSTAINGNATSSYSGQTSAKYTSYASVSRTLKGNTAYYGF
ncbi:MAG: lactococcin 972 family bacteriocin [Clostridium sp.]|nr:lactococcin 972 family bacteriocin [Clostridium sp.]